jgi:hypothetical protein
MITATEPLWCQSTASPVACLAVTFNCWGFLLLSTPHQPDAAMCCCYPAGRIVASADECQGHWQQKDYKAFSPGTDW